MTITSFEEWLEQIDTDSEDLNKNRDELYALVKQGFEMFDGPSRADLLWRMGRAAFKLAGQAEIAKNGEREKKFLYEAEEWCKKSLTIDPSEPDAHLWLANIYGKLSYHLGTKERIGKGKEIQQHLEACIKSRSDDFNAHYTYGRWCIEVAKLTWLEKKIASALFDKPPEATYQDAIKEFEKVNELRQGWRAVSYYIGKCWINLKDYKQAIQAFDAAAEMDIKDEEDKLVDEDLLNLQRKYSNYRS